MVVAELEVGLARKLKLGSLSARGEAEIRQALNRHLEGGILRRIPLRTKHYAAAGRLAADSPVILRTLDAIHLAVTIDRQLQLATFDRRLQQGATALGLGVVSGSSL